MAIEWRHLPLDVVGVYSHFSGLKTLRVFSNVLNTKKTIFNLITFNDFD